MFENFILVTYGVALIYALSIPYTKWFVNYMFTVSMEMQEKVVAQLTADDDIDEELDDLHL